MIKKLISLSEKQIEVLNEFGELSFSEHVRRAIDEYIRRLKIITSSASASK